MTNEQILKLAIEKAVGNGFVPFPIPPNEGENLLILNKWITRNLHYAVIFSHSFAKACWGEEYPRYSEIAIGTHPINYWQMNLQNMVLEPEPLKYLEQFLK